MKLLGNDYSDRVTPDYTRAWAEQMLCELEAHLPRMRRTSQARNLDELLFAMIVLGDDRLIEKTVIAGQTQFQRSGT